ncbi:MAG: stage III sporulation protein AC [Lachnospiraceae bacterium]
MEVGILFKIAAVGILITLLSQVLKHSGRDELAFLSQLVGFILVISWIVPYILELFELIEKLLKV